MFRTPPNRTSPSGSAAAAKSGSKNRVVTFFHDIYHDSFKWQLVKSCAFFLAGIWISREVSREWANPEMPAINTEMIQMGDEDEQACDNLLKWLSTLQLPIQRQYSELPLTKLAIDGRWLAEALQHFDGEYFDAQFVQSVATSLPATNNEICNSNMRKVLGKLERYYDEHTATMPNNAADVSAINRQELVYERSSTELLHLLWHICGVAFVLSPDASYHVTNVHSSTDESILMAIMRALQTLNLVDKVDAARISPRSSKSRESPLVSPRPSEDRKKREDEVRAEEAEKHRKHIEDLEKRLEAKHIELTRVVSEKQALEIENERLAEASVNSTLFTTVNETFQTSAGESFISGDQSTPKMVSYEEVKRLHEQLVEERNRSDDLSQTIDQQHKTIAQSVDRIKDLERELADYATLEADYKKLRDEKDELMLLKQKGLEAIARSEALENRLGEQAELKRENAILRRKVEAYMASQITADEQRRRAEALEQTLGARDARVKELMNLLDVERERTRKADNECEQLRNRTRQLSEQLEEYKRLREDQEAQLAAISTADVTDLGDISNISEADAVNDSLGRDLRDAVSRERDELLEKNDNLRKELEKTRDAYHDMQRKYTDLEMSAKSAPVDQSSAVHDSQLADLNARMERLDIEKSKALAECENLKQRLKDAEHSLKQRESARGGNGVSQATFDEEAMEKRFGEALRQAATIIRAQDVALREFDERDQGHMSSRREFHSLIAERDKYKRAYEELKEEVRRDRTMFEQEQQLVVTAYYRNATQLSTTQEMLRSRDKESMTKGMLSRQRDALASRSRGNALGALTSTINR